MDKVLDVINFCCSCMILSLVLTRFLNNGRSHQSNAAFFYSVELFALEAIFSGFFRGFSICSSYGR